MMTTSLKSGNKAENTLTSEGVFMGCIITSTVKFAQLL